MNTAKLETLKNKHQQMAARIRAMEAKSMIQQRKEDTNSNRRLYPKQISNRAPGREPNSRARPIFDENKR